MIFSDIEGLKICRSKYEVMGEEKPIKLQFFPKCHTLDVNFWITVN